MDRIVSVDRVTFCGEQCALPANLITELDLKTLGDARARVITNLPRWGKDWALDHFPALIIQIASFKEWYEDYEDQYKKLLAELSNAFKKVESKVEKNNAVIVLPRTKVAMNDAAMAEGQHLAAVAILKNY